MENDKAKEIKYFAYYANHNDDQKRKHVLAATNKIDYICEALNRIGCKVEIISASATVDRKRHYSGKHIQLNGQTFLKLFYTFPWGNIFQKILSLFTMKAFIFGELMKCKRNDAIIVYHSMGYMNQVRLAHKLKKFKLILEVEEIYSDVSGNKKEKKREMRFVESADGYVFPTQLLKENIKVGERPIIYIHGTYKVEPARDGVDASNDGVHCVYAGTFDPRKGGAAKAAAAAEFLPAGYHMHILGFGNESDTEKIKSIVAETQKKTKATVSYDGLLSGEDYIRFIQGCDIGLSTQNPDAEFNNTSFPSKILSYLANGLRVVSIRIPAIERSYIGDLMYYYDEQTPRKIAEAILSVDLESEYNSRTVIAELAAKFEEDLKSLI